MSHPIAVLVDLDIQEKDVRHVSLEKCLIKCKEKGENILTFRFFTGSHL